MYTVYVYSIVCYTHPIVVFVIRCDFVQDVNYSKSCVVSYYFFMAVSGSAGKGEGGAPDWCSEC